MKRLVLVTRSGPEHYYVANRLHREVGLAAIIVDEGRRVEPSRRFKQLRRKYTLRQAMERVVLRVLRWCWRDSAEYRRQLADVLGEELLTDFFSPERVTRVAGINTAEGIAAVRAANPDALLIYGTGVVGKRVLSQGIDPPLNMHTGISPFYRGTDCAFWPLHNEDLGMLGATVHECSRDIDGGNIYATRHASLESHDQMFSAFARSVKVGADLYVETSQKLLAGKLVGEPQDLSKGVEYRSQMRGLRAELRVRRLIRNGSIRRFCSSLGLREAAP
jgi:methionyl-tRNA formyltransferase